MLQDIYPHHLLNQYVNISPEPTDYVLLYQDNGVILSSRSWQLATGLTPAKAQEMSPESLDNCDVRELCHSLSMFVLYRDYLEAFRSNCSAQSEAVLPRVSYLFTVDDVRFFLVLEGEADFLASHSEYRLVSLQQLRVTSPRWAAFACLTGFHLYRWYREHRYCGRCGDLLRPSEALRSLVCPKCHNEVFPRISPGVIVGLINGESLLLVKYANRPYKNYGLVAGFTEIGEALEDTVRREVAEEVGLEVDRLVYYANQPWAFSQSLLVGFFATVKNPECAKPDGVELGEATWFSREEIPQDISSVSLTGTMIAAFRQGRVKL